MWLRKCDCEISLAKNGGTTAFSTTTTTTAATTPAPTSDGASGKTGFSNKGVDVASTQSAPAAAAEDKEPLYKHDWYQVTTSPPPRKWQ